MSKNNARPCEAYSWIVGYYRLVPFWNVGKKQEFSERTTYDKAVKKRRKRGDEQN